MAKPKQPIELHNDRPDGHIPPQAVEIEAQVLGAMLTDKDAIPKAVEILTADDFHADYHRKLFEGILALYADRNPVDTITVAEALRKKGHLDLVGGEAYLVELTMKVTSGANVEYHAKIVLEKSILRGLIITASTIAQRAYSPTEDTIELLEEAYAGILALQHSMRKDKAVPLSLVASEVMDEIDHVKHGKRIGIPFGFDAIDRVTGGKDPGNLVVIKAPRKTGKSVIAIQDMFYNADRGTPSVMFSAEMTRDEVLFRKAMIDTQIRWMDYRNGRLSDDDYARLCRRVSELAPLPIYIRQGEFTALNILAESEALVRSKGVKQIIVDYIQLVAPSNKKETREQEVSEIARMLKMTARQLKVPVIAIAAQNKDGMTRESGGIEYACDKLITLTREEEDESPKQKAGADIIQRMGLQASREDVPLIYDVPTGSWQDKPKEYPAGLFPPPQSDDQPF